MHLLCPHCHNPMELARLDVGEVACPSCGSSFRIEGGSTTALARTKLGKFELLTMVGSGAFGTVYKAHNPELDRTVAVKVPRAGNLPGGDDLGRFLREARSVAQLRHPAIVPIYEVGHSDGLPYLVSEFVEGVTLADLLSARRPPPRDAAQLIAAIADALQYAHEQGVVHRDVKPSNVMLDGDGQPHVMDFGLAKRDAGEITMTIDGQVLGTPAYMSPEQARGDAHQVDGRSDVYSLGVILYQLLTGELPFRGTTRMLLHQVLHDEPRPPRRLNDRIPRDLETICLKAMAKEPTRRYQTARDLADDLRRFLKGEPIQARPMGPVERFTRWCRRKPMAAGLLLTLLLATVTAFGLTIWALGERDRAEANAHNEAEARQKAVAEKERADLEAAAAWANQYIAHANRMESDWENANVGRILDTLDIYRKPPPGRKDVRGWEWYYQERLCNQEVRTLKGHAIGVFDVTFSPDGTRLASASGDGTVKLWDAVSGQELRALKGHSDVVWSVAFNWDGTCLASTSFDHTVKVWDTASGQELHTLKHKNRVFSVAFHPDGTQLASADMDGNVKQWAAESGRELRTFNLGHLGTFSPDGTRLASVGNDQTVTLLDAISGQELRSFKGHTDLVWSVAVSPDGTRLASADRNGTVKLWDTVSGQELRTLHGHMGGVDCVAFSPDGTRLASTSRDRTVRLWDVASGQTLRTVKHTGTMRVTFSPDGARLAWGHGDGMVKLWDISSGQDFHTLEGFTASVAFSADARQLVLASGGQSVMLWDPATGQELRTLNGHSDEVRSVAFSPDGKRLASASQDRTVKVWDTASGMELRCLKGHADVVFSVAFSPDGTRVASASQDRTVKVWDAASGKELACLKGHSAGVLSVAFSPDGARLASASYDYTAKLWDAVSGQELRTFTGHIGAIQGVAFSPDGTWLASASHERTVKLWEVASGQQLHTLKGHTGIVMSVAFGPDGMRLASGSNDKELKLWDAISGQELRTLKGNTDRVFGVAFSPDGHWLAAAGGNGGVRLWDARPLTPDVKAEVEAVAVLDFLFSKPLSKSEVRAAIQRDKAISEAARNKALELTERFKEETDPQKYYAAAWPVIRHPFSNVFTCQFALSQMNAAWARAPDLASYRLALGVAQYRLGKFQKERYQDALATLTRCDLNQPLTLAFLAMTQHQLGQKDQAQTTLARLREIMKALQWASNEEAQTYLREAAELIEAKPPPPGP